MAVLVWLLATACVLFRAHASSDAIENLGDDSFSSTIQESNSVWLIDFYALEPLLEEAAVEASGFLRVAKVNVDANPALQARYEIVRYPTLMYGRWNSRLNQVELKSYPGDRTVASLVKFGKRLSADVVSTVSTEADWQRFLSVDGSMLFLGFQHEDNAPPSDLVAKFHREASQFHKHHVFVSSNEPAILSKFARPAPFIARVDANQDEPFYYDGDLPFPSWVEKNRYPSYAAFEASNVKHIGWFRILVIGCYMPEKHPGFESTMQSLASYTTSPLSRAHQDHFAFGWLDSERYEHYLTKFFVYPEQAPTLFVWNMQDQVFYNYEGRPTDDVDAIAAFLTNVLAGKEPAIAQGNYFIKIYRYMVRESPWSLLWLVPMGLVGFFLVWGCAAMWFHDSAAEKRALDQSLHPAGRRTSPSKKAE